MEQEALEFVRALQRLYLEQRDMDNVLELIDEKTSWIGTGRQEICKNFDEATAALFAEKMEYQSGFTVTDSWYKAELLSADACVVFGEFWAKAKDDNADVASLHHRVSAVCVKTLTGMKLLHLHMSSPDDDQQENEYYVKNKVKSDNRTLQTRFEQTAQKLYTRNREMDILTANIPGGVHQIKNDDGLTILSMSDGFIDMFGYTKEEISARFNNQFINMVYKKDRESFINSVKAQILSEATVELEYRVLCKNGELMWVLDRGRRVTAEDGTETLFCMMMDITDGKAEKERLRLLLERHKLIMNQTRDIVFEWDIVLDTIDFSSNWKKKFGYLPISEDISKKIVLSDNIYPDDMPAFIKLMQDTASGVAYSETEIRIQDSTREYRWFRIRATTQFDTQNKPIKAVGVIIDIDEEKNRSHALMEEAQRDALTMLYNKRATKARVEKILADKGDNIIHALMIIDVDNFKAVNDRLGHQCGDAVLSNMAQALKKMFRASDIIGRIGGDEFLVFMPSLNSKELAAEKAAAIVDIFKGMKLDIDAELSCSVGIALYPQDAVDYIGLSRYADSALYHVKNNGKVNFAFYEKAMREIAPDYMARTAINNEQNMDDNINEELIKRAFEVLYSATNIKTAIMQILETAGKAYGVSRAYVFETSLDGQRCSNTFEWCNTGITPTIGNLQELSFETDLKGFFDNYDENGVFYCQNIDTLQPNLRDILAQQGIESVLQCFIQDEGEFRGYVGFDECKGNRYWTKAQIQTLTLVANILSTFLTKERLKEQLAAINQEKTDKKSKQQ